MVVNILLRNVALCSKLSGGDCAFGLSFWTVVCIPKVCNRSRQLC